MKWEQLVAEFLGWTQISETSYSKGDRVAYENYFRFAKNQNWNDLMPLVKKCFNIEVDEDSNLIGDLSCALLNVDIDETYVACVELIKYLNEKK
jgi:hypothetical protein